MDTISDDKLDQLLSGDSAEPTTPEHRAWMNRQITETLAKKARGEITYKSLDSARRDFIEDAS